MTTVYSSKYNTNNYLFRNYQMAVSLGNMSQQERFKLYSIPNVKEAGV